MSHSCFFMLTKNEISMQQVECPFASLCHVEPVVSQYLTHGRFDPWQKHCSNLLISSWQNDLHHEIIPLTINCPSSRKCRTVFKSPCFHNILSDCYRVYIVIDAAFPTSQIFLTPCYGTTTDGPDANDFCSSQLRVAIELAIGTKVSESQHQGMFPVTPLCSPVRNHCGEQLAVTR